jgi:hypothetical protein
MITFATSLVNRDLNNSIKTYVDHFHDMTYDLGMTNYSGGNDAHPWHNSCVRRDTTYTGYGNLNSMKSIDENMWWETYWFNTPYSKFAVGIPLYGSVIQCPSYTSNRGVKSLSDSYKYNDPAGPRIKLNILYTKFVQDSPTIWTALFTNTAANTPFWDDVTKASWIKHDAGSLGSYYPNHPSYGSIFLTNNGTALGDAFVSYPSVRFIQEAIKWEKEQRNYGGQTPAGYMGGVFTFSVLGDFIADKSGDARYPLSTAVAEAMDLNAWTYSDPVGDGQTNCWQTTGNTIQSVYDSSRRHRVTCITPPTSGPACDTWLLDKPGGTANINETTRCRYLRFAIKSSVSGARLLVLVKGSNGVSYWVEYYEGDAPPTVNGIEVKYYLPDMADGNWHTYSRDLQADFSALVSGVAITSVYSIKVWPYPTNPAHPTYLDDITLFQYAPPLGEF